MNQGEPWFYGFLETVGTYGTLVACAVAGVATFCSGWPVGWALIVFVGAIGVASVQATLILLAVDAVRYPRTLVRNAER